MAEQNVGKKKKGPCHYLTGLMAALFISLLLSIVLEWLGIAFLWPDEGHLHSQQMMIRELGWLSEDLTRGITSQSPKELAEALILDLNNRLFIKTGLRQWLDNPAQHSRWELWVYHYARAYIESVIYVSITFVIRLIVILFSCPLFLLAAFAGLTEGMMMRDLRKFGAGRESSFVYHHARRLIAPVMISAWIVYLSVPVSIYPNLILMPAAFLFGLSICVTFASFKKYL
ncbi:TIGR03747 family integrating conjugative element membrane protein [Aggregatibacter actinomycetemcomitans]|uniref:TIGR03747 family integrating conjugative element membrane protein n=1 Tax=Aggregatibacter actinomycetemcomitans TaxID=714 RepID=UPI00197C35FE|nr:TIGR03747 family integrating conjugative element membrane protein [Aggregatibacter actinomycetemcomitans]MBN6058664.1 TIGR03747 family integrating conjugative element membrane protein [Aggregatibacter actinomycetemcomitans]MBN6087173.1 TIGR03747 family integrating conjugative element membrane protein [Aggregatibacter actinomycetemcomitans]